MSRQTHRRRTATDRPVAGEPYLTARFSVPREAFDLLAGALWEANTLGLTCEDTRGGDLCEVVAYFAPGTAPASVLERMIPWLRVPEGIDLDHTVWERLEDADWNRLWRSCYGPIAIGRRLLVAPSWSRGLPRDRLIVRIKPEMAFGTGSHETTRLCLEALEEALPAGLHLGDIGTGSGILALAAARLGAQSVVACDVDPVALANARYNLRLNRLGRRIKILQGDAHALKSAAPYDGLVANLVLDPIRESLPIMTGLLKQGGFLYLSGLLEGQDAQLQPLFDALGLTLARRRNENEWLLLALTKGPS